MARAVNRQPLTAEAGVRVCVSPSVVDKMQMVQIVSQFIGFRLSTYYSTVALNTYISGDEQ
jgi:hypothetical protein